MTTEAAFRVRAGSPLEVDRTLYGRIGDEAGRTLVDSFEIPIRSGQAWEVPEGTVCRISTVEGPQVGNLNLWNLHNPRERFWASRTRQLHAAHVSTFDRLWSTLPYLRPLATIVGDTLAGHGSDDDGARVHDLLGTRCDPYVVKMLRDMDFDYSCHSNLVRAVQPYRLTELDVHDTLNVFQRTGINEDDRFFLKTSPATPGDYFEMFAETDLLMALSTCPGGDMSVLAWGGDAQQTLDTCRPICVELFSVDESVLADWTGHDAPSYRGDHGFDPVGWDA
jgi:uncharacterized protein YcgI (DUF1989 family)